MTYADQRTRKDITLLRDLAGRVAEIAELPIMGERRADCVIEMIFADTHTCQNDPRRFTRWTDIAGELAEKY